jgi:hypothetical protein
MEAGTIKLKHYKKGAWAILLWPECPAFQQNIHNPTCKSEPAVIERDSRHLLFKSTSTSEKISDNKKASVLLPADEQPDIAIVKTGFAIVSLPNT